MTDRQTISPSVEVEQLIPAHRDFCQRVKRSDFHHLDELKATLAQKTCEMIDMVATLDRSTTVRYKKKFFEVVNLRRERADQQLATEISEKRRSEENYWILIKTNPQFDVILADAISRRFSIKKREFEERIARFSEAKKRIPDDTVFGGLLARIFHNREHFIANRIRWFGLMAKREDDKLLESVSQATEKCRIHLVKPLDDDEIFVESEFEEMIADRNARRQVHIENHKVKKQAYFERWLTEYEAIDEMFIDALTYEDFNINGPGPLRLNHPAPARLPRPPSIVVCPLPDPSSPIPLDDDSTLTATPLPVAG